MNIYTYEQFEEVVLKVFNLTPEQFSKTEIIVVEGTCETIRIYTNVGNVLTLEWGVFLSRADIQRWGDDVLPDVILPRLISKDSW